MLKFMYKFATPWATASKAQILKNRILGRLANYIYPVYCRLSRIPSKKNKNDEITNEQVIVSLTSFPKRIDKIYLCIQSILRQTRPADEVILWLADTQFPDKSKLPNSLKSLERNGLEIKFCDDLRSYKKVFYTAQEYTDSIIITADDDTMYPEDWIERMLYMHMQHPDCVTCYRAHRMTFISNNIAPYLEWISMSPGDVGPSMELVPIGVGGVLYPSNYFKDVEMNATVIRSLCPTTDDLWLKVIGIKGGYKVVKVDACSKEWFTILSSQKKSLMSGNVDGNENDESMKRLVEYYKIETEDVIDKGNEVEAHTT